MNNITKQKVTNKSISQQTLWWLIICQLSSLLIVYEQLTSWMLAVVGLCLCWRALMNIQQRSKPSKGVIVLFAVSGSILLAITAKQLGLLISMLHLLCFSYGLKSLELTCRKDIYLLSLLGVFIAAAALIFAQSVYFSLVVILLVIANFVLLMSLFLSSIALKKQIKTTLLLFVQSIPLALVLFVVFPKLPPFWKMPLAKSNTTGLSDSVQIGDIAQLAMSDALAFRVDFGRYSPKYSQLYWRAVVLEYFDGKKWTVNANKEDQLTVPVPKRDASFDQISATDNIINYQIIAEPSFTHWLYALDVATVSDRKIIQTPNYNLYSVSPITKVLSYQVQSNLSLALEKNISPDNRSINLAIMQASNPKLTQEGIKLRQRYQTDEKIIAAVLKHFNQQPYFYTLKPPLLENNSLDQFYFETRAGFCEYYASSFAYLMRAANIPARLVLGYMGGEINPNLGYYSIYQRDAHAWVEVWLQDKGWQRIDPTAAVNPERVESGFSADLLAEQADFSNSFFSAKTFDNFAFLNTIRLQLQALDYQWTRFIVGYSAQQQNDFLSNWLGNLKPWKMAAVIGVTIILVMMLLWFMHFYKNKPANPELSEHLKIYQQAVNLLAKKHIIRQPHQSASEFCSLVANKLPDVASCFMQLSAIFITLAYKNNSAEQQKKLLGLLKAELHLFKKQMTKK